MRRIYLNTISTILQLLILFILINNIQFVHSHKYFGEIIVHAHPYNNVNDNKPLKHHHHTEFDYINLSYFNIFIIILISLLIPFLYKIRKIDNIFITVFKHLKLYSKLKARAPPQHIF